MNTLTAAQAKQVIAYFGAQAAEDAPEGAQDSAEWDTHAWQTMYAASLAIERRIPEHDWHTVIVSFMDQQSFDRDPAGYLHERGYDGTASDMNYMAGVLEDLLSWAIDLAYINSGA